MNDQVQEFSAEKLEKVIETIRRLQAKVGQTHSIAEMEAAVGIANSLMQKYRISQVQVDLQGKKVSDVFAHKKLDTVGKRSHYRELLIDALCKTYSSVWHMKQGSRETEYVVVATESDYDIIDYFYNGYLVEEIEGLADRYCKGKGHTYSHSWRIGCANAIAGKFAAIRNERAEDLKKAQMGEASQSTCQAMVLLDKRAIMAKEWQDAEAEKFFCKHCGFACNRNQEEQWKIIQVTMQYGGKPNCPVCKKSGKMYGMKNSASLTGVSNGSGYSDGKKVGEGVSICFGMNGGSSSGGTKGELT